jgi:hypothetical protein
MLQQLWSSSSSLLVTITTYSYDPATATAPPTIPLYHLYSHTYGEYPQHHSQVGWHSSVVQLSSRPGARLYDYSTLPFLSNCLPHPLTLSPSRPLALAKCACFSNQPLTLSSSFASPIVRSTHALQCYSTVPANTSRYCTLTRNIERNGNTNGTDTSTGQNNTRSSISTSTHIRIHTFTPAHPSSPSFPPSASSSSPLCSD